MCNCSKGYNANNVVRLEVANSAKNVPIALSLSYSKIAPIELRTQTGIIFKTGGSRTYDLQGDLANHLVLRFPQWFAKTEN